MNSRIDLFKYLREQAEKIACSFSQLNEEVDMETLRKAWNGETHAVHVNVTEPIIDCELTECKALRNAPCMAHEKFPLERG